MLQQSRKSDHSAARPGQTSAVVTHAIDGPVHGCMDWLVDDVVATAATAALEQSVDGRWRRVLADQRGMDARWYQTMERLRGAQATAQDTLM